MYISLSIFLRALSNPGLLIVSLLILAVVFVNGWTDAPNAIATVVASGALSFRRAVRLAAVCNLLGVTVASALNAAVAENIYRIADFHADAHAALCALCAALLAIVLWSVAAWRFGIPTSESHALVAGITGAAVALPGGFSNIRLSVWGGVLFGLVLSIFLGFFLGRLFCHGRLRASGKQLQRAQVFAAAAMATLHGAQDGQKFMGTFLLGTTLASGYAFGGKFSIPLWLMLLCAATMALGTRLGGKRIVDTVGREMVTLNARRGLAADLGGAATLLVCTLLGLPVSTTHTKTASILGAGSASGGGKTDWSIARSILLAWVLTFPICGLIGFFGTKIFLYFL